MKEFLILFENQPGPDVYPKLEDLPEECIREIILRINDHRDLEASSAAWTLMAALASEQRIWRELSQFHFTKNQIDQIIQKQFNSSDDMHSKTNTNTKFLKSLSNLNFSTGNLEGSSSKFVSSTKDWQKIYHALRRYDGDFCYLLWLLQITFLQEIWDTWRLSILRNFGIM